MLITVRIFITTSVFISPFRVLILLLLLTGCSLVVRLSLAILPGAQQQLSNRCLPNPKP